MAAASAWLYPNMAVNTYIARACDAHSITVTVSTRVSIGRLSMGGIQTSLTQIGHSLSESRSKRTVDFFFMIDFAFMFSSFSFISL